MKNEEVRIIFCKQQLSDGVSLFNLNIELKE